ncbi:MAG: SDR family oxidoreductase [Candidatus Omnitrophota bacterium]
MNPKNKKVILITGCSSGFGLLSAARLSAQGHRVYATMRNLEKKQALLDEVEKRGGQISLLALDVTKKNTIAEAINKIKTDNESIDVLINNAGFGIGGYFEDLSDEEIREQMETNFFGVLNVTREVLPLMRAKRKGMIINISSISGLMSSPAFSAYNASKWALEGFSESLYYELKEFGIPVVLIEPGLYKTEIFYANARYANKFDDPQSPYFAHSQFLKKRIMDTSSHRAKDPEDVARLIERIIDKENPYLRYIPDQMSGIRFLARRILPFRFTSHITNKVIFSGFEKCRKTDEKTCS